MGDFCPLLDRSRHVFDDILWSCYLSNEPCEASEAVRCGRNLGYDHCAYVCHSDNCQFNSAVRLHGKHEMRYRLARHRLPGMVFRYRGSYDDHHSLLLPIDRRQDPGSTSYGWIFPTCSSLESGSLRYP